MLHSSAVKLKAELNCNVLRSSLLAGHKLLKRINNKKTPILWTGVRFEISKTYKSNPSVLFHTSNKSSHIDETC